MYKLSIFILFMGISLMGNFAHGAESCQEAMSKFLVTSKIKKSPVKKVPHFVNEMEFSEEEIKIIQEGLNEHIQKVDVVRMRAYLVYARNLSDKERRIALLDFAQLDQREINSKFVKKFIAHEDKIKETTTARKLMGTNKTRYQDLYYGCRSFRPNDINKNAAKDFKRFNLSLSLGTLAASYAFYNMDKEMNGEWFAKLGYDVGMTIFFSYTGGKIQTNVSDTQIVKSLKSYFTGRVIGLSDIVAYSSIFNHEKETAQARFEALKKDPAYKDKIEGLLKSYENRSLYHQYREELIASFKELPDGVSLGLKGNSVDENNVDWNNLSREDLDRPEVQEVLMAASMAQVYEEVKGEWIDTGNIGLDRYVFNTFFYAAQIPKSIVQNFVTYRMLCMGQDNAKLSFTKAVAFNVTMNFLANQVLFGYRQKAINQ